MSHRFTRETAFSNNNRFVYTDLPTRSRYRFYAIGPGRHKLHGHSTPLTRDPVATNPNAVRGDISSTPSRTYEDAAIREKRIQATAHRAELRALPVQNPVKASSPNR